jgi:hypothetical protein
MKRKKGIIVCFGVVLSLIASPLVWGDGGRIPDQKCPGVSPGDEFFTGTFTATYKNFPNGSKPTYYHIKYKIRKNKPALKKDSKTKVWKEVWQTVEDSFDRKIPSNPKGLCIFNTVELIQVYDPFVKRTGKVKAAEKLGFTPNYEACLTDVKITDARNCNMNDKNARVSGEFTIRIYRTK